MKKDYNVNHRILAYILLFSLILQSCKGYSNIFVLKFEEENKEDISHLLNEPLSAEGGHQIVIYEVEGGAIQAEVEVNISVDFHKTYKGVPVFVGNNINLKTLGRLNKKSQKQIIQATFPTITQPGYVYIGKRGILGGMMEGDEDENDNKEKEPEKGLSAQEIACHRLNFNMILPHVPSEKIKDQLLHDKIIGSGGFGYVYKCVYQGEDVAIKVLNKSSAHKDSADTGRKEAIIMANNPHPNIVAFKGFCPEKNALVMEYVPGGNLKDLILNCGETISFQERYQIALDIAEGLCYLHDRGIVHCDLKSANILLDNLPDNKLRAKITDFGISGLKTEHDTFGVSEGNTLCWVAPEIFYTNKNSKAGDVYSYGMILWQLWACKEPFENVQGSISDRIKAGNREEISEDTPSQIRKVINLCWLYEPPLKKEEDCYQRPTMKQVRHLVEKVHPDFLKLKEERHSQSYSVKKEKDSQKYSGPKLTSQVCEPIQRNNEKAKLVCEALSDEVLIELIDGLCLPTLPKVSFLDLSGNKLSKVNLSCLGKLISLAYLNLSDTQLNIKNLEQLKGTNLALNVLDLRQNPALIEAECEELIYCTEQYGITLFDPSLHGRLGMYYQKQGEEVKAIKIYEDCQDPKIQLELVKFYLLKPSNSVEFGNGINLLLSLARQGNKEAQYMLGHFYAKGDREICSYLINNKLLPTAPSKEESERLALYKAEYWYKLAAKQGHKSASKALGCYYESSEIKVPIPTGEPQDERHQIMEALKYYRMARKEGSTTLNDTILRLEEQLERITKEK